MLFYSISSLSVLLSYGPTIASSNSKRPFEGSIRLPKVGSVVNDCRDCPDLVAVPEVGHNIGAPGAIFFVTRFEVTWKEYLASVKDGVCPPPKIPPSSSGARLPSESNLSISDNFPVTLVPPNEFKCYIRWLKLKTGLNYRFPSSLEWEHFANAGTIHKYPWGDDIGFDHAAIIERIPGKDDIKYYNFQRLMKKYNATGTGPLSLGDPRKIYQSDNIWPVGSFEPNAWGLFDVIGNAEEVTNEASAECLKIKNEGNKCPFLVTRGRGFLPRHRSKDFSLISFRGFVHSDDQSGTVGYRLVRDR